MLVLGYFETFAKYAGTNKGRRRYLKMYIASLMSLIEGPAMNTRK